MALIHPKSCECFHSGLDLFSVPPTQTAVEEGYFVEIQPLAALSGGSPIEFTISGQTDDYLDFFNTYLHLRARITSASGEILPEDTEVGPVNYYLHSLISQVDVSLNGTLVTPSENTYPYRAYLEATLSSSNEAKMGYLTSSLYYSDNHMDELKSNVGFTIRKTLASQSSELDMMGRLHSDIFTQERYLLNGVDVKIKLTPSKDAFNLIATTRDASYKSVITYAALVVRKAKINPSISLAHEKALLHGNVRYPLKRVLVKSFAIPKGMISYTQDNLFLSQTPTRLVIALMDSLAFNGSYDTNPFNFKNYGLNYLNVALGGHSICGKPLSLDYDRGQYARAYFNSLIGLSQVRSDAQLGLSYQDFMSGYAFYAFDLSPSLLDGAQFELARAGPISIEIKFARATSTTLQAITYAELDSVIEISKTRNVTLDYAA